MKKTTKTASIVFAAVLIVFSLFFLIKGNAGVTADTVQPGSYISVPTYGYLQCHQSPQLEYFPALNDYTKFDSVVLRCQDFGTLIQDCGITFKMPSSSEVAKQASGLTYRVCDNNDVACSISGSGSVTKYARYVYLNTAEINAVYNLNLLSSQFIRAQYNEADVFTLFTGAAMVNKGRYQVQAKPWYIYRQDDFSLTSGQKVPGTEDCTDAKTLGEANLLITGVSGGGQLANKLKTNSPTLNIDTAMRAREATFYYISNFVAVTPQYDMFPDGTKYCYDKKIYAVETVQTSGGYYKVANTATNAQLQTVECCNGGDAGAGYYCSNFKKVPISGSEGISCSALKPCPIVGYQAVPNKQVVYQTCDSGVCSAAKYKTVACNNAFDCNGGICIVDALNPSNNYCKTITPQDSCGNGACEASRGETIASCPKDCAQNGGETSYLWWIIGGLILLIIIIVAIIIAKSGGSKTTF